MSFIRLGGENTVGQVAKELAPVKVQTRKNAEELTRSMPGPAQAMKDDVRLAIAGIGMAVVIANIAEAVVNKVTKSSDDTLEEAAPQNSLSIGVGILRRARQEMDNN